MTLVKRGGISFGAPVLLSVQKTSIVKPDTGSWCRFRQLSARTASIPVPVPVFLLVLTTKPSGGNAATNYKDAWRLLHHSQHQNRDSSFELGRDFQGPPTVGYLPLFPWYLPSTETNRIQGTHWRTLQPLHRNIGKWVWQWFHKNKCDGIHS